MNPGFQAMNGFAAALSVSLLIPRFALGQPAPEPRAGELCLPAIAGAEAAAGLPAGLLRSIAHVESGRADPSNGRVVPWPWTINAAGTGAFFETKEAAIAAVRRLLAGGVRSIDIGCAQVNLLHHPDAFASLEDAFDPVQNTAYAARFLNTLRASTGNWPAATAGYHSLTPDRGRAYAMRVMAVWPDAARFGPWPEQRPVAPRQAMSDLSIYVPAFEARVRRMDEDRARLLHPRIAPGRQPVLRPPLRTAWARGQRGPG